MSLCFSVSAFFVSDNVSKARFERRGGLALKVFLSSVARGPHEKFGTILYLLNFLKKKHDLLVRI